MFLIDDYQLCTLSGTGEHVIYNIQHCVNSGVPQCVCVCAHVCVCWGGGAQKNVILIESEITTQ